MKVLPLRGGNKMLGQCQQNGQYIQNLNSQPRKGELDGETE
jgi:hypothetical protein